MLGFMAFHNPPCQMITMIQKFLGSRFLTRKLREGRQENKPPQTRPRGTKSRTTAPLDPPKTQSLPQTRPITSGPQYKTGRGPTSTPKETNLKHPRGQSKNGTRGNPTGIEPKTTTREGSDAPKKEELKPNKKEANESTTQVKLYKDIREEQEQDRKEPCTTSQAQNKTTSRQGQIQPYLGQIQSYL